MRAVVCGAGISGLSAAACLARDGWQVLVVDQAEGPRPQGYMIDFFGPGWQAAAGLGILPRLRELGYQIQRLDYVDRNGRARVSLPFSAFVEVVRGELTSILRPDLELAIREMLPPAVELHYGRTVVAVGQSRDAVTVTLDDGQVREADLLIGADGIHSGIREIVFGPEEEFLHYLGFQVGAYSFSDAEVAERVGARFAVTDTRNEAMFFYRLRDGRITAMAVHRTDNPALPDDPQALLRSRYRDLGWICPAALDRCPEDIYYDQVAQIRMPRWHTGRVVLLGDAAAAVSLLAGQGASLGMAAADVLAEELGQHPGISSALASFEARLRPLVTEHQNAGVSAAHWFVPATRGASLVRRTAIRLAGVPGMTRVISSAVIGKSGSAL
ncbi:MAG TPA: FAD-dependent oxidoreductase [Arthrobacter sp.]|nr:FAD-dependent oxidoreductase [Arthrobacter sp.]